MLKLSLALLEKLLQSLFTQLLSTTWMRWFHCCPVHPVGLSTEVSALPGPSQAQTCASQFPHDYFLLFTSCASCEPALFSLWHWEPSGATFL